ncbi:hypothetical protein [Burkholderia cepacia]|uniref:hypothetical protein n=1 Tax=Burkholderia cepacia TaxID=292 RepID=UPI00158841B7|nr:hypothetical protein [Burkholderia cepacia]
MDRGSPVVQAKGGVGGGMNPGRWVVAGLAACRRGLLTLAAQIEAAGLLAKMRGEVFPEPEMKKGRLEADLFRKQMVPRRGLGHTCATPAALASAAFRVLAQSAQALCFLGLK